MSHFVSPNPKVKKHIMILTGETWFKGFQGISNQACSTLIEENCYYASSKNSVCQS